MPFHIHEPSWAPLNDWLASEPGRALCGKVVHEYAYPCAPRLDMIFRALEDLPLHRVRAVVLGQDPYPQHGVACGRAFATEVEGYMPPSLDSIDRELYRCFGRRLPNATLQHWVDQGVLLLNPVLTVAVDQIGSHQHLGWQGLTDQVIELVLAEPRPIVWLLFGAPARRAVERFWIPEQHKLFRTTHPSPRSAYQGQGGVSALYGSDVFRMANRWLVTQGAPVIAWA